MVSTDRSRPSSIETIFDGAYGEAGASIVVEGFLRAEVSLLALSDDLVPWVSRRLRIKRRTMETRGQTRAEWVRMHRSIFPKAWWSLSSRGGQKVLEGMAEEGMVFRGVLYVGLMLTQTVQRSEFIAVWRSGVSAALDVAQQDLLPILKDCADELKKKHLSIRSGASARRDVEEYPGSVEKAM